MLFVNLGGDESRPSYFEVKMADGLYPSLRAAIIYAATVFSQQGSPWLQGLLEYQDEAVAALVLLLDAHGLGNADATFAESLYGLQRKPLGSDGVNPGRRISGRQRIGGLALHVALFYMMAKADRLHEKLRLDQGVLRLALAAYNTAPSHSTRARHWTLGAFYKGYPILRSAFQSIHFSYQLLYLVGSSPVHSPILHLLGMKMTRASAMDLNLMAKDKAQSRSRLLARFPPSSSLTVHTAVSRISRALIRASFFISDHHQSSLLFVVFGYKALEWWFYSAEGRLKAFAKALPPPPPPPRPAPLPPSLGGIGLPSDPSLCPLCHKRRSNPTQVATSGYVLCYPCAFSYVSEHKKCPVTHFRTRLDQLRKIYEQKDEA